MGCFVRKAATRRCEETSKAIRSTASSTSTPCVAERADVDARAEDDEEERDEEPLRDAGHLAGQALRAACGSDQTDPTAEACEQDARPDPQSASQQRAKSTSRAIRRSSAQPRFLERRRTRPTHGRGPRRRPDRAEERRERTRRNGDGAEDGADSMVRLERERHRDDRYDVGDRDLRGDGETDGQVHEQPRLVERRDEHCRRAAGKDDGVDAGVRNAGRPRRLRTRRRRHPGTAAMPAATPFPVRAAAPSSG